jgi:hypothetical protein
VFAAFFTHATWPEITFETTPPGATLVIDGKPRAKDGKVVVTPVLVRVQPNVAHAIELRMPGHVTRRIEPKVELGYLESRTYTFTLERQSYRVAIGPVPGKVSVNGQPVGEGTEVELGAVPGDGPITLRVEAAGHIPFEYRFTSAKDLQPSTDVVLRPEPPPAPAPSPSPPPRRR